MLRIRISALLVFLTLFVAAFASPAPVGVARPRATKKPTYVAHPASDLKCRPFGECEPCPEDDLSLPFCQPFGNRRLLHCIPAGADEGTAGEVPAWEACGKVLKKEKRDFYEFIMANVLVLAVCLVIYGIRTSTLAAQQYRQLAARIGIPSGAWRV